ncbi:MAG: hypothetical protein ACJAUV_002285 [Flavobacteriales bacterium]|jgi:hypothetical protein
MIAPVDLVRECQPVMAHINPYSQLKNLASLSDYVFQSLLLRLEISSHINWAVRCEAPSPPNLVSNSS